MIKAEKLFSVKDRVILLTGASQGIGRSLAELFISNGAKVALVARNQEKLENVARQLNANEQVAIFPCDVTNTTQLPLIAKEVYKRFGAIDVLINNAGTNITKPAEELSEKEWDDVLDLNLKSAFFFSQAVYPYMKEQHGGKIIHMSSQMAEVGYYKRSAYCSSKGGVKQLTKALAIEWAKDHILVNSVGPTFIETPLTNSMFKDEAFKKDVYSRIPLGKLAKAEDLFGAILYLSSPASNMVTGQTLYVDGGWTSW
ncbi:SDR family NAD(P)-dependent oxidoreductase [Shouchella rhizosphaerae]|uniref:SDR family NAD(P)-dependent oxidoreductase n=1 Tax=Shouchella rhizosphaerae TaxID=866786 RepID=UPI003F7FC62B